MGGIFISYRREDSGPYAGRLRDALSHHFGANQVFRDIDTINPGERFPRVIEREVGSCEALLAVIGPMWLSIKDDAGRRRLDNPDDYVRLEIATALGRGTDVLVIPVLVGPTSMPAAADLPKPLAALAECNAVRITDESWDDQVARLTRALEKVVRRSDPRFDAYWDSRARGVESAHVPGTYFTGRRRALTELVEWLVAAPQPGDNLRVVTGGPGSGKSGVLARLVTASDPGFRRLHPPASGDAVFELPAGAVDVAVPARDLDATQILQALAERMDIDATDVDVDELVAGLAAHGRPVTVVVDGLDESSGPRQAAAVLRRTAAAAADLGVRLLVGTRPGPQSKLLQALGAGAARTAIDLDDHTYLEKADLAEYVRRRLLLEGVPADRLPARDTPYRGHDRLAERVAAGVADRAYPSFLIAALTAVGLIRRGTVVDVEQPGWDQFPTTVADAMADYLDRFDQDRDRVEDLLRPLAYSYGDGLPADELWAGLATRLARPGRTYTVTDIGWLLDTAADYLLETTADTRTGSGTALSALPPRPRSTICGTMSPARPVEEQVYQSAISTPPPPREGLDWQHAHPYILTHLADHAAATGHLGDLVDDPGFLLAANPSTLTARLRQVSPGHQPPARAPTAWRPTSSRRRCRLPFSVAVACRAARRNHPRAAIGGPCCYATSPLLAWTRERARYLDLHARSTHFGAGVGCGRRRAGRAPDRGHRRRRRHGAGVGSGAPAPRSGDPLTGHTGAVRAVAAAVLDGRPVAVSASDDATVRVWDLATGAPVGDPLTGHTGGVRAVAVGAARRAPDRGHRRRRCHGAGVGPDHRRRRSATRSPATPAGGGGGHGGAARRAPGRGHRRRRCHGAGVGPGHRRAVGDPLTGHTGGVAAVATAAVLPDGPPGRGHRRRRRTVRVWDLTTGAPSVTRSPATPAGGRGGRGAARRAPGRGHRQRGRHGAGVGPDHRHPVGAPLTGHTGGVSAVAAALDGRPVAVTGSDATVRVWDLRTPAPAVSR